MAESEANAKEKQYALWGLGRGIDITKPTPWLEKTSFQVRKVEIDIIETDDGGLLKEYSDEICCRTDLNCEVKSGVKAANAPYTEAQGGPLVNNTYIEIILNSSTQN